MIGLLPWNVEVLIWIDDDLGLEVSGAAQGKSNFAQLLVMRNAAQAEISYSLSHYESTRRILRLREKAYPPYHEESTRHQSNPEQHFHNEDYRQQNARRPR